MRFVLSTHSGLYFADGGSCTPLAKGYYYGIATYPDYFVALRRLNAMTKVSPTLIEAYGWDGVRLPGPELDGHSVIDAHQATGTRHGLYITDTAHNQILFVPHDPTWLPAVISLDDGAMNHKPNSVFVEEDVYRMWVMEHNQSMGGSRVRVFLHAEERWEQSHHVDLGHEGCHNVLVAGNGLYYNASQDGMVVKLSLDGEPGAAVGLGEEHHTKGMAMIDDTLVVGVSEGDVEIEGRFTSRSGLVFIDTHDMTQTDFIHLRGPDGDIGNINEVRVRP